MSSRDWIHPYLVNWKPICPKGHDLKLMVIDLTQVITVAGLQCPRCLSLIGTENLAKLLLETEMGRGEK